MCSAGHDFSLIQHENLIRVHNAGNPLGDDHLGRVGKVRIDRLAQPGVCFIIQRRAGIIQNQNLRVVGKRPR